MPKTILIRSCCRASQITTMIMVGCVVDEVGGRGRSDTNRVLLTVVEELFTVH